MLHSERWARDPHLLFWVKVRVQRGETGPGEPLLRSQSFLDCTWISWWPEPLKLFSQALYCLRALIYVGIICHWQRPVSQAICLRVTSGLTVRSRDEGRTEDFVIFEPFASSLTLIFIWCISYLLPWKINFLGYLCNSRNKMYLASLWMSKTGRTQYWILGDGLYNVPRRWTRPHQSDPKQLFRERSLGA